MLIWWVEKGRRDIYTLRNDGDSTELSPCLRSTKITAPLSGRIHLILMDTASKRLHRLRRPLSNHRWPRLHLVPWWWWCPSTINNQHHNVTTTPNLLPTIIRTHHHHRLLTSPRRCPVWLRPRLSFVHQLISLIDCNTPADNVGYWMRFINTCPIPIVCRRMSLPIVLVPHANKSVRISLLSTITRETTRLFLFQVFGSKIVAVSPCKAIALQLLNARTPCLWTTAIARN